MNFLKRLFGLRPMPEPPTVRPSRGASTSSPETPPGSSAPAPIPPTPSSTPAELGPNPIQVFDQEGREHFLSREEWRRSVLPGILEAHWLQPDLLYVDIVAALDDGFRAEVVEAAKQLHAIDPKPARGASLRAIVLMEEGQLDEAEKVLRDFLARHGEEGAVLTNLAKIAALRQDPAGAETLLERALEVDPNQGNAVAWYEAICRERDGEAAGVAALGRIAALPGSWRAQLGLARAALAAGDLDRALALYRESLARAGTAAGAAPAGGPPPVELLLQMSGDLGERQTREHLQAIVELVEPQFDAAVHGLEVGNNLLRARLELGQPAAARRILDQLHACNRPDWKGDLALWDAKLESTDPVH